MNWFLLLLAALVGGAIWCLVAFGLAILIGAICALGDNAPVPPPDGPLEAGESQ